MVPLRVGAAEVLHQADQRGIPYVLVHHGPKDRIKNGTYARAHHRVEAPQLIELARRLGANQKMLVTCVAFAFREGIPTDSALVVDARCLDNPYWVDELRDLDGRDPRIAQFVLNQHEATVLLDSLDTMLGELLPAYRARGRMELTLAFGCNGGRQRSVALAVELARRLQVRGNLDVGVELRRTGLGGANTTSPLQIRLKWRKPHEARTDTCSSNGQDESVRRLRARSTCLSSVESRVRSSRGLRPRFRT